MPREGAADPTVQSRRSCRATPSEVARMQHESIEADYSCAIRAGSGESGKSTVVKQMKIIHQNGYSKDELVLCRATIYKSERDMSPAASQQDADCCTSDVMDSAQALVMALRKFKMDPVEPVNRIYADKIMEYRLESSQTLGSEIVKAVESLWHDPIIPSVLDRGSEFYLMDSAS